MASKLTHLQFNVRPGNTGFYKDLLEFLGWKTIHADDDTVGAEDANGVSVWFLAIATDAANSYDGPGMNHVAFGAETAADVDAAAVFLRARDVDLLFETPRHRPEFTGGGDANTYYQVMFESPDRILVEVVYQGPKAG